MEDSITGTNVREESIAKTLTFGSTLHQTGNIDDIEECRHFAANKNNIPIELVHKYNKSFSSAHLAGLW